MSASPSIVINSDQREKVVFRKRPKAKSRRIEGALHRPKSMVVLDLMIRPKSKVNNNNTGSNKTTPLTEILHKKKCRENFKNFLLTEYSAENLYFWTACENYRKSRSRKSERLNLAREIYETYVSPNSATQVNIPHCTRKSILQTLTVDEIPQNLFDSAQKHIYSIMENDSYSRFILSPFYKRPNSKSPIRWGRRSPSPAL